MQRLDDRQGAGERSRVRTVFIGGRAEIDVERRNPHAAVREHVGAQERARGRDEAEVRRRRRAAEQVVGRDLVRVPAIGRHGDVATRSGIGRRRDPLGEVLVVVRDDHLAEGVPKVPVSIPGRAHARRVESTAATGPGTGVAARERVGICERVVGELPFANPQIPGRERRAEVPVQRDTVGAGVSRTRIARVPGRQGCSLRRVRLSPSVQSAVPQPVAELRDGKRRVVREQRARLGRIGHRSLKNDLSSDISTSPSPDGRHQRVGELGHLPREVTADLADVRFLHRARLPRVARMAPPAGRVRVVHVPLHAAAVFQLRTRSARRRSARASRSPGSGSPGRPARLRVRDRSRRCRRRSRPAPPAPRPDCGCPRSSPSSGSRRRRRTRGGRTGPSPMLVLKSFIIGGVGTPGRAAVM